PKQYADLGGVPMLTRTLEAFAGHRDIDHVLTVIHPHDMLRYQAAAQRVSGKLLAPVAGGASRQISVHNGLEAVLQLNPKLVLIHDAARPFVTRALIDRVMAALTTWAGVLPGLSLGDTLKRADASGKV